MRSITARHWLLLFIACTVVFSNYYCYDIPAALNVPLQQWLGVPYNKYQWQINLLYSVYSLPNVILPLIGGMLVDTLSPTTMLLIFAGFVCVGHVLFATGVSVRTFPLMVLGRVVFGAGGESLEVAASRITTDWFKGRGLGFAMSLHLSMARIAAASNDNLSPWLSDKVSTPFAVWFGGIVCLMSFFCAIAMIYLDRPASREAAGVIVDVPSRRKDRGRSTAEERTALLGEESETMSPLYIHQRDELESDGAPPKPVTRDGEIGADIIVEDAQEADTLLEEDYDEEDETIHFSQLRGLSWSFWMLCLATIGLYGASVPFFHICTDFFQQKWYKGDSQMAGMVMSIPDIVSAFGSPLCGLLIDRFGHRSTLLPISGFLVLVTHALLCWTTITPIFSMSVLGVGYSIFASALWTCVVDLVGSHQIATAYGLMAVALNMSLSAFPIAVARIRSAYPESFVPVELFFMALSILAIVLSVILYLVDAKNGWILRDKHRHGPRRDTGALLDKGSDILLPDVDEDEESFDEDDVTVKVLGDGVIVQTPHTHIHHHHHGPTEPCTCAENNGGRSPVRNAPEWSIRGRSGKSRESAPSSIPPNQPGGGGSGSISPLHRRQQRLANYVEPGSSSSAPEPHI